MKASLTEDVLTHEFKLLTPVKDDSLTLSRVVSLTSTQGSMGCYATGALRVSK